MTHDFATLLYTYISRFSVNPHHQQMRKIWQSCCHKFYPPAVPHCVFQLLSQMAHVRFHRRKWVLTRLRQQDRTQRPTRRNRGVSDGALSLPSERSARSQTSPGRVSERRTLPLLGLGRVRSRRTQKACGTAMRLCASLFRGAAAPLGCTVLMPLFVQYDLERWKDLTKRSGRVTITRNDRTDSRLALVWEPLRAVK